MNDKYKKQVALLIKILPNVYQIEEFAVHGGTAINMFHKNMIRYSVDIEIKSLCPKAQKEFNMGSLARIVPFSLLVMMILKMPAKT